jgi:hypothetical protein
MAWQKIRLEIPENIGASMRDAIGEAMVKLMADKARDGVGVRYEGDRARPREFPAYTKKYADFKGQDNVDLTLSGDMLDALKVLSHKKGSILIGFDSGSEENGKAEGNITGSYGRNPNPRKARNFLGLLKSEINKIVRDNQSDTE